MDIEKFQKLDSKRASNISLSNQHSLSGGVEGAVSHGTARLHKNESSRIVGSMITKKITVVAELPETSYTEIRKKHSWLKKRGFPVVPTIRINEKHTTLLMTDVTQGGRLILIDKHTPLSKQNIEILNLELIHSQLRAMALSSFNEGNGVVLGSDSFALVYDPYNKIAEIILVDIGRGTYIVGNYKAKGRKHDISENLVKRLAEHAIKTHFS